MELAVADSEVGYKVVIAAVYSEVAHQTALGIVAASGGGAAAAVGDDAAAQTACAVADVIGVVDDGDKMVFVGCGSFDAVGHSYNHTSGSVASDSAS